MSDLYKPTITDIILVKEYFGALSTPLPLELIDQILDDASYWAHSSVTVKWDSESSSDKMYMRTPPFALYGTQDDIVLTEEEWERGGHLDTFKFSLEVDGGGSLEKKWLPPRGKHPCRMIKFNLWSSDQGWSHDWANHGTYRGSYTWFDASIETVDFDKGKAIIWPANLLISDAESASLPFNFIRMDTEHPFLPPPTHLQRNIHAQSETHHHTITWHYLDSIDEKSPAAVEAKSRGQGWKSLDGSFVRSLEVGDCVTLWIRARFPGWRLYARKAKIDLYWAV